MPTAVCSARALAQLVVVVQVLVSQGQAENPLPDHRPGRVQATGLVAWIVQNPRHLLGQSQHPIQLPQQHRTAVGSNRATGKKGSTSRPLQRGKRTSSGCKRSVLGGPALIIFHFFIIELADCFESLLTSGDKKTVVGVW